MKIKHLLFLAFAGAGVSETFGERVVIDLQLRDLNRRKKRGVEREERDHYSGRHSRSALFCPRPANDSAAALFVTSSFAHPGAAPADRTKADGRVLPSTNK